MSTHLIFTTFLLLINPIFNTYNTPPFELNEAYYCFNNPKKLTEKRKISIVLESVLMMSNNHVGDDWLHFLTINDQVIYKGESLNLTLESRAPLRVEANSVEQDKDYPDTGINHMDFIYSDLIAIDKNRFEMDVTIVENGGQYAGNMAVVKFLFLIKQI